MPKILFISAHAPTNLYPQAGQKIALCNLNKYHVDNTRVDIVVIANKVEINAATDLFVIIKKTIKITFLPILSISQIKLLAV